MEDRIRAYVDSLFATAPSTQKAYEMKVELTGNLIEKYSDLLAEGKTPDEALSQTIDSIGDVTELFASLEEPTYTSPAAKPMQKSYVMLTVMAIMIYILSIVPLIIFQSEFGLILMFVLIAIATGIIVAANMTKPKNVYASGENVVTDFRNWQDRTKANKQLKGAVDTVLWAVTLLLYFLISFRTNAWHITWLIFIVAVAVEGIIQAIFAMRNIK